MTTTARWRVTCDGRPPFRCSHATTYHPTRGGAEAEAIDAGWTIESDHVAFCRDCQGLR